MAGVKRVLRGGPAEDPLQNYPTEEHQNAKVSCDINYRARGDC